MTVIITAVVSGLVLAAGQLFSAGPVSSERLEESHFEGWGSPERLRSPGDQARPRPAALLQPQPQPQACARPGQLFQAEGRAFSLGPSVSPGDARPGFLGGGTPGPEPGPRPVDCSAPPGLSPAQCPKQKQRLAEICLLGRLFTRSAWKASQRGPTPSLHGDPGGKKSRDPVSLRGCRA